MFDIENKALWTIKMTLERRRKICIFPKRLTHGFGLEFEISSQFVFLLQRLRYTVPLSS